jgi:hypothetical protein
MGVNTAAGARIFIGNAGDRLQRRQRQRDTLIAMDTVITDGKSVQRHRPGLCDQGTPQNTINPIQMGLHRVAIGIDQRFVVGFGRAAGQVQAQMRP